jgi:hypothetical protein
MAGHPREEIESAFAEFRKLGAEQRDWPAWAGLFTDDATYIEHYLGRFTGRAEIEDWIVSTMKDYPAMTFSIDWWIIEDDRVVFYIWNHLPDPAGGDARYSFPNLSIIHYAGDGKWDFEEDEYNPADAERVFGEWLAAGGRRDTAPDESLVAIPDYTPEPPPGEFSREEIDAEFEKYKDRARLAVSTGDWDQWADQFTEDARYYEHHYGRFNGREEIRAWIKGVMQPFPTMEFPYEWHMVEGNRLAFYVQNRLPDPTGGDDHFDVPTLCVLHYAGNGQWAYEEDCYNPREFPDVVMAWVAAGGELPEGLDLTVD